MQSAPSEASQNATSVEQSPNHAVTLQHGVSERSEPASGHLLSGDDRESHNVPDEGDTASVSSSSTHRGRRLDAGRLSSHSSSSQESSPGSRIDEYERSNQYGRRIKKPMAFKIVPSVGKEFGSISLDKFPNGQLRNKRAGFKLTVRQRS